MQQRHFGGDLTEVHKIMIALGRVGWEKLIPLAKWFKD